MSDGRFDLESRLATLLFLMLATLAAFGVEVSVFLGTVLSIVLLILLFDTIWRKLRGGFWKRVVLSLGALGIAALFAWRLIPKVPAPAPGPPLHPPPTIPFPTATPFPTAIPTRTPKPVAAPSPYLERQDVELRFVSPTSLAVYLVNPTGQVVREPKYTFGLWNLDRENFLDPLPIPIRSGDWIKPRGFLGRYAVLSLSDVASAIKTGDRILGFATVTCPLCALDRSYLLFVKHGEGGWYYKMLPGYGLHMKRIVEWVKLAREDIEKALAEIPPEERIPISD